jgi:hypothetical protein
MTEDILQKFLASWVIYAPQIIALFCVRPYGIWENVTAISANIYQDKYYFLHVYKNSISSFVGEELLYVYFGPYNSSE